MTKCDVCQIRLDRRRVNCSICVNNGAFRLFKEIEITESPTLFLDFVYEQRVTIVDDESQTFAEQFESLKKINEEKRAVQLAFQKESEKRFELQRTIENVKQRKSRLLKKRQTIEQIERQLAQKKDSNQIRRKQLELRRDQIDKLQIEIESIVNVTSECQDSIRMHFEDFKYLIRKITEIGQKRIDDWSRNIFPIERLSTIEDESATRNRELAEAQNFDNENFVLNNDDDQYQIVHSSLPANGNYLIEKFASLSDSEDEEEKHEIPDVNSIQWKIRNEFHHFTAALGYACQLTNVLAEFFGNDLPHDLSHVKFNVTKFDGKLLRTIIDELNANIVALCRSQNLSIENKQTTQTLVNLSELLSLRFKHPQAKFLDSTNYSAAKDRGEINSTPSSTTSSSPSLSDEILDSFYTIDEDLIRSLNSIENRTSSSDNPNSGENSFVDNSNAATSSSEDQTNSWTFSSSSLFNAVKRVFSQ